MFFVFLSLAPETWHLTPALHAQTPATTTVKDTVYRSDGSLASGTVVITWPAFVAPDTKAVFGGTKTLQLATGALAVALVPNSGGTPSGTSYHVKYYQSGGVFFEETWVVPTSSPVASPAAPTSVTQTGTPGTTTYYYWVSATNANGETLLGPSRVTTTSNATLSMTNYNVITWASVSGATGYRVWRTSTSTAPTGTGNYLAGSTASTTLNDQSNTLSSATIPSLNTTDPRTLSQVRVAAAPSPSVVLSPSQITGTAIVAGPSTTQVITAPATAGVVPLRLRGSSTANTNVLEIYDSAATPVLQSRFDVNGALNTAQQIISTLTTGISPFSVASTTKVTNLNVDQLDGIDSAALELLANKNQANGYAGLNLNGTLDLARGGTNQTAWTSSRCVRVNTAGTALEAAPADCSAGAGAISRIIEFSEGAVATSGSPTELNFDNVRVVQLPNAADSEINVWFRIPVDAVVANDILLLLNFAPDVAPGATNNKVKLKTTARVNNTSAGQTAGDTITLANDTNWASYTATANKVVASTYAVGDLVQMKILRDTTVANNAAVGFNIGKIAFRYTSSQ